MNTFLVSLFLAAFLCSLVAGFLIAFAIVVMPGIHTLGDKGFLKSFKQMDLIIQRNNPIFILIWAGSVLALLVTTIAGFSELIGIDRILLIVALVLYLLAVQASTIAVNVPLNNQLQKRDLDSMSLAELKEARDQFEPRWVRWNNVRTAVSTLISVILLVLIYRVS